MHKSGVERGGVSGQHAPPPPQTKPSDDQLVKLLANMSDAYAESKRRNKDLELLNSDLKTRIDELEKANIELNAENNLLKDQMERSLERTREEESNKLYAQRQIMQHAQQLLLGSESPSRTVADSPPSARRHDRPPRASPFMANEGDHSRQSVISSLPSSSSTPSVRNHEAVDRAPSPGSGDIDPPPVVTTMDVISTFEKLTRVPSSSSISSGHGSKGEWVAPSGEPISPYGSQQHHHHRHSRSTDGRRSSDRHDSRSRHDGSHHNECEADLDNPRSLRHGRRSKMNEMCLDEDDAIGRLSEVIPDPSSENWRDSSSHHSKDEESHVGGYIERRRRRTSECDRGQKSNHVRTAAAEPGTTGITDKSHWTMNRVQNTIMSNLIELSNSGNGNSTSGGGSKRPHSNRHKEHDHHEEFGPRLPPINTADLTHNRMERESSSSYSRRSDRSPDSSYHRSREDDALSFHGEYVEDRGIDERMSSSKKKSRRKSHERLSSPPSPNDNGFNNHHHGGKFQSSAAFVEQQKLSSSVKSSLEESSMRKNYCVLEPDQNIKRSSSTSTSNLQRFEEQARDMDEYYMSKKLDVDENEKRRNGSRGGLSSHHNDSYLEKSGLKEFDEEITGHSKAQKNHGSTDDGDLAMLASIRQKVKSKMEKEKSKLDHAKKDRKVHHNRDEGSESPKLSSDDRKKTNKSEKQQIMENTASNSNSKRAPKNIRGRKQSSEEETPIEINQKQKTTNTAALNRESSKNKGDSSSSSSREKGRRQEQTLSETVDKSDSSHSKDSKRSSVRDKIVTGSTAELRSSTESPDHDKNENKKPTPLMIGRMPGARRSNIKRSVGAFENKARDKHVDNEQARIEEAAKLYEANDYRLSAAAAASTTANAVVSLVPTAASVVTALPPPRTAATMMGGIINNFTSIPPPGFVKLNFSHPPPLTTTTHAARTALSLSNSVFPAPAPETICGVARSVVDNNDVGKLDIQGKNFDEEDLAMLGIDPSDLSTFGSN